MYGGKFAFENRLGQLIIGRKCTIFALFYFVFEAAIYKYQPPQGAYIRRGDVTEVFFFCVEFGRLIFGGAYTRRSLCSEFYGITKTKSNKEEDRQ